MKTKDIDLSERFEMKYRPTVLIHEIIARRATLAPHRSMQRIIDDAILTRRFRSELKNLRSTLRDMGHKDHEFYPPALLRRLGIKVPPGRPRRRLKKTKRA